MSGAFGKEMAKVMTSAQLGHYSTTTRASAMSANVVKDVSTFVEEFADDGLFEHRPGRSHHGFEAFTYIQGIKNPIKMGEKMKFFCADIDNWDEIQRRRRGKTTLHLHMVNVTDDTASFASTCLCDGSTWQSTPG